MNEEIKVPKVWLETLLRYNKRTADALEAMDSKLYGSERRLLEKIQLHKLIGYASSAETILKYRQSK